MEALARSGAAESRALGPVAEDAVGHLLAQSVRYAYSSPVNDLRQRLVLLPPEAHGRQRRVSSSFSVAGVEEVTWVSRGDRWGNTVVDVHVPRVHEWVEFVIEAGTLRHRGPLRALRTAGHYLPATRLTEAPGDGPFAELVSAARRSGPEAICGLVHRAIRYSAEVTGVLTTAAEALAGGAGVCQDYAHLMVAVCRAVGLPARYVSGHLAGEGASHAWVETLAPVRAGDRTHFVVEAWDPTHDRCTDGRYLTVATGRDYSDVAPLSGTFEAEVLVDAQLTTSKSLMLAGAAPHDRAAHQAGAIGAPPRHARRAG